MVVPHHTKAQIVDVREIQKSIVKEITILLGQGLCRLVLEFQRQRVRFKTRENFVTQILWDPQVGLQPNKVT